MQDGIHHLPAAIVLSRRATRLVLFNIVLALGIHVVTIILAATVGIPLWLSVFADNGSLLVVVLNSLWPLFWRVRATTA